MADVQWRRRWRLGGWGLETTSESSQLESGDDVGDFADVKWRQRWRLGSWGVEMNLDTSQM